MASATMTHSILTSSSVKSLEKAIDSRTFLENNSKAVLWEKIKPLLASLGDFEEDSRGAIADLFHIVRCRNEGPDAVLNGICNMMDDFLPEDDTIMSHLNGLLRSIYGGVNRRWESQETLEQKSNSLIVCIEEFRHKCKNYRPVYSYNCETCNPFVDSPDTQTFRGEGYWVTQRFKQRLEVHRIDYYQYSPKIETKFEFDKNEDFTHYFDWTSDLEVKVEKGKYSGMSFFLVDQNGLNIYRNEVNETNKISMNSLLEMMHHYKSNSDLRQRGPIEIIKKCGMQNLVFAHSLSIIQMIDRALKGRGFYHLDLSNLGDMPLIFGSMSLDLSKYENFNFKISELFCNKSKMIQLKLGILLCKHYGMSEEQVISVAPQFVLKKVLMSRDMIGLKCTAAKKLISDFCQKMNSDFRGDFKMFEKRSLSSYVKTLTLTEILSFEIMEEFLTENYIKNKEEYESTYLDSEETDVIETSEEKASEPEISTNESPELNEIDELIIKYEEGVKENLGVSFDIFKKVITSTDISNKIGRELIDVEQKLREEKKKWNGKKREAVRRADSEGFLKHQNDFEHCKRLKEEYEIMSNEAFVLSQKEVKLKIYSENKIEDFFDNCINAQVKGKKGKGNKKPFEKREKTPVGHEVRPKHDKETLTRESKEKINNIKSKLVGGNKNKFLQISEPEHIEKELFYRVGEENLKKFFDIEKLSEKYKVARTNNSIAKRKRVSGGISRKKENNLRNRVSGRFIRMNLKNLLNLRRGCLVSLYNLRATENNKILGCSGFCRNNHKNGMHKVFSKEIVSKSKEECPEVEPISVPFSKSQIERRIRMAELIIKTRASFSKAKGLFKNNGLSIIEKAFGKENESDKFLIDLIWRYNHHDDFYEFFISKISK